MNKEIRTAGIFGIINLIITIPILAIEVLKSLKIITGEYVVFYVIAYLIYIVTYVLFIRGFVLVGKKLDLSFLINMSHLLIVGSIIWTVIQMFTPIFPQLEGLLYQIIVLFVFGAISIPFGISLLKLKKKFGGIATGAGVLNIIIGASLVTVLLSFIGVFLFFPAYILEIILLFNASKKL